MLSSDEDEPRSEAPESEPGLGWLGLIWLPVVGHVRTRLGQSQIQPSLTERRAFIHTGSENNRTERRRRVRGLPGF